MAAGNPPPVRQAKTLTDVNNTGYLDFSDWEENGSGIGYLSHDEMPGNVVDRFRAQFLKVYNTNPGKTQGKLIINLFSVTINLVQKN